MNGENSEQGLTHVGLEGWSLEYYLCDLKKNMYQAIIKIHGLELLYKSLEPKLN